LFVFAGTFDPHRLIETENSPFNVAHHADTSSDDFSLQQVVAIAERAGVPGLAEAINDWTGGHPYLTTALAARCVNGIEPDAGAQEMLVDDVNLSQMAIRVRQLDDNSLLLLDKLLAGEEFPYGWGMDPGLDHLLRLGLIRPSNGNTAIRCKLYRAMIQRLKQFTRQSPKEPVDEPMGFVPVGVLRDSAVQLLDSAPKVAASCPALATAAAGSALETILLGELEREGSLSAEVAQVNLDIQARRLSLEVISRPAPDRWTLAQMIEVAQRRGMVTKTSSQVSHGVRDWRNLIHPAKLRQEFPDGVPLDVAESSIAATATLIRELGQWRKQHP
jgi:hypothetical protein